MPVSPARATAFSILLSVERQDSYAAELLHSGRCAELSEVDQGLTTELVMGVLRWQSMLDQAISSVSSQNLTRLDTEVLIALRLGAYQLGWLDRIPARAAIHESVELVKQARKRSAASFANAVLRKLAVQPHPFESQAEPLMSPQTPDAIATTSAHPLWLVERWVVKFGVDVTAAICSFDQKIPTTAIRLRSKSVEEELRQDGIDLEPGAFLTGARRVTRGDVTKTRAYSEGRIAIQDEASQLVAALIGTGLRILDCCAAPGGKTWSIADRNPEAKIVAVDLHARRADLLRKRVQAAHVEVIASDIRNLQVQTLFDRVLVDAPCSGTGTIARNPEIKWRLKPEDLVDLHSRQLAILQSAAMHVAPGGKIVYSTCSLEAEENESVIEEALSTNPTLKVLAIRSEFDQLRDAGELRHTFPEETLQHGPFLRTVPGLQPCDGFFAAILQKT
jgi:16S rRNA (cytosine967-C5)-methyltransferase